MRVGSRSRRGDFVTGAAAGGLFGLLAKDLELNLLVSYWGERSLLVVAAALLFGVAGLTPLRKAAYAATLGLSLLWLAVAFTPATHWLARGLVRQDPLEKADAVFVLGSMIQPDGDLSTNAMSRLLHGLRLLGDGWAPRLILSENPDTAGRYTESARAIMSSLGLGQEVLAVGPVRNTHDEAVQVSRLCRERGFDRVLVVTSPTHSRRAAEALETEGVEVVASPSMETAFDFENLSEPTMGDQHLRSFGPIAHERIGLLYYRLRGYIR